MKLTVEIHRHEAGHLTAYVVQDNNRGKNLLAKRQLTKTDSAHIEIRNQLYMHDVRIIDPPEAPAAPPPISTARDNYGIKGPQLLP